MRNDEFNNIGPEDNPKIEEFKRFDAIEYFQPKEMAKFYDDNATPPENSADVDKIEKTKKEPAEDIKEKLKGNSNNQIEGNAQTSGTEASVQSSPTVEGSNIADVAEIEAAAASASTGVTVAATSASLTGGVSVICSVVVVAATVASTVLGKAPKILSYNFETGTDYIKYQINLAELNPEVDYSIRVTSNDYKEVFPVTEEGIQTQLLTGLNPNWKYEVSIIGDGGDLGDYIYKTYEVYTMKLKKPDAVFKFTPYVDYEEGIYSLDYETYISDYFHTGSDTYMEVWTAGVKIFTDDNLNDESYFIGSIEDLLNELLVEAKVYTMYYGELTLVGSYEFETKYPLDFKPSTEIYRGTYDVKEPETEIKDNKLSLTIDTGFESKDPKDAYIIDIYEGGKDIHLTADTDKTPLYSFMGKEKVFTASIPIDVAKIDIYYTPIKILAEDNIKRFETSIIMSYTFSDEIINEVTPTGNINVTENINKDDMEYNLDFDVSVTDKYEVGHDYSAKVLVDEELVSNIELIDNSITSSILDLDNNAKLKIIVYYKNKNDEEVILGEKEVIVEYPLDFISHKEKFTSTYDLDFTSSLGDDGFNFNINTNFIPLDTKDYYLIEIYNGEELIETKETNENKLSFVISYDISEVKVILTEVKKTENYYVKYDTSEYTYSFEETRNESGDPLFNIETSENIDKEDMKYNLDFETSVTDKYEIGHDYKVKVLVDEELISDLDMLDNSVTSSILDLDNNAKVKIIIYYKNRDEEEVNLPEKEIIVEYPIDFISHKEEFMSTYDLEFSSTLGDDGFVFNINTNLDSKDIRDYYIIDIYNGEELIDSKETNEKELSFVIPYSISEVKVELTEVKKTESYYVKYDSKESSYSFEETRSKALNPTGIITVTDNIDTENEIYNLDYEIEVTDLYKKGSNYKLVISVDDLNPQTITLDGYSYSGKLEDLGNNQVIKFELYATINDEEILIETKEKEIVYADDFISYNATYEVNEDEITSSFNASKGFDININSSFSNNGNENEKYIIRVYNGETLLDEKISSEESIIVTIPSDTTDIDIHFIPVKVRTSGNKEFEESVLHYDLIPFKNIKFNLNKENVIISMNSLDEESTFDLAYDITLSSGEVVSGTSSFSNNLEETIDQESKDITSIKVNISYQDNLIRSYTFNNASSSEIGEYEVTEEGYIKLPISISIPEDATFKNASILIDKGAQLDQELEGLTDEVTITEITENTISGMIYYSYETKDGYIINKADIISINLNAEIDVDYFASFVSSVFYANLDFKSMLGDKEVDTDLDIEVYNQEQDKYVNLSELERDAKFYKVKIISKMVNEVEVLEVKYKVKNSGFDNEEKTISFDPTMNANLSSMSGDLYNYTFNDPRYVKVENDDNTFNYYIDTGATLNNANLSLRIEGTYQDEGVTKYYYSPFITDNTYVIKNMTGNNFEFKIGIYYLSGGIYYRTESKTVKEFTASSAYNVREDSIYYDDATGSTNIEFSLNYDGIMSPQDITVKASGVSYQVELKSSSDLDTLGGSYSSENSDYSYQVTAQKDYMDNYNKWIISLTIKNKNITSATLTYVFYPESLIDKFDELAGVDLGGSQTQDIAVFRGTVDTDNITVTPTFDIYYGNKLTVKSDFASPDYRDYLRYEIVSNGEVIYSTFDGNQEAIVSFGSYYTLDNQNVTLRIKQLKIIGSNEIVYDTIYEEELTLEKHEIVTNQSVSVTASGYSYQAKIDSDYKDEIIQADVIEYYSDGTTNEEEIDVTVSGNDLSIDVDHSSDDVMTKLTKVEVRVRVTPSPYSSGNLVSVYSYVIE